MRRLLEYSAYLWALCAIVACVVGVCQQWMMFRRRRSELGRSEGQSPMDALLAPLFFGFIAHERREGRRKIATRMLLTFLVLEAITLLVLGFIVTPED